ncbi:MAG: FtsH protease activity modulator HflK [Gammaproteobacteria bacterium]|nr:FtsH protease activity modulator HflK [Gammaproteobacteria bacterium]
MAWNEPGGNDNDPWGNRKNNSGGPPDLDEVFNNLKNKFGGLFGKSGRGSGSGSRGGLPTGNIGGKGIAALLGILAVIWLVTGFYIVQPAERAVVTQFGAYKTTEGPGLHWHIPWPVEMEERVDIEQIRSANLPDQLILTQDENIVDIDIAVLYNIKNAENYLFKVREPDDTLRQAAESALREVIGQTNMELVTTTGREANWERTLVALQSILDSYESGIHVVRVNGKKAKQPAEVQAAFDDVVKAREDRERFISEAEAYRNDLIPKARGDAQRIIEEAEGYKTRVEQAAIGESQRFLSLLSEFEKAPVVTRDRLYLESMETVLSNTSKVLVDSTGGNSLMYLPIDKLIENRQQNSANGTGLSSEQTTYPQSSSQSGSTLSIPTGVRETANDVLRSRDRAVRR